MDIDAANYLNSDIFQELNLGTLSEEQKNAFIQKFLDRVQKNVLNRIIDFLTDEDKPVFDQMIAQDSEEAIGQFIKSKNIDIEQIVAEESGLIKEELKTEFSPGETPPEP